MAADPARPARRSGMGGTARLPARQPRPAAAPRRGSSGHQRRAPNPAADRCRRGVRADPAGRRRPGSPRPRRRGGAHGAGSRRSLGNSRGRSRSRRCPRRPGLVPPSSCCRCPRTPAWSCSAGGHDAGLGARGRRRVGGRAGGGPPSRPVAGRRRHRRDNRRPDRGRDPGRSRHLRGGGDSGDGRTRHTRRRGVRRRSHDTCRQDRVRADGRYARAGPPGARVLGTVPAPTPPTAQTAAADPRPGRSGRRHGSRARRGGDRRRGRADAAPDRAGPSRRRPGGRRRLDRPLGAGGPRRRRDGRRPAAQPGPGCGSAPRPGRGDGPRPGSGGLPRRRPGVRPGRGRAPGGPGTRRLG